MKFCMVLCVVVFLVGCSPKPVVSSDIEPFLGNYFSSWSSGDIKKYRSCFHDHAIIFYIKNQTIASRQQLEPFIESQEKYLKKAVGTVRESMTSFRVDEDKQTVVATVKWVFEEHGKITHTGVDRFTLLRDKNKNWKIISLVWYKD